MLDFCATLLDKVDDGLYDDVEQAIQALDMKHEIEYIVMPNFSKKGAKEKNYAWNFMSTIIKVVERPKT